MPYYTHHKYKGVHHYVCVDVSSDGPFDGMPYYTHHKYKGVHHYVYHRNNCIQHYVHEVGHSECPGKNEKVKH